MALKCGIVGLPNVGKSTLFNCLSKAKAQSANFPFCTIEPNVGVITVPDERLEKLAALVKPEKVQATTIEIVDIAGLVKGASKGEGLGNKFLANIRECNAIIHVLRCFDDDNIVHVDGSVNPIRDKETIDFELQIKDLEAIEKKRDKYQKIAKSGDKEAIKIVDALDKYIAHLEQGESVRSLEITDAEKEVVSDLYLLTAKPVLYVCNVDETSAKNGNKYVEKVKEAIKTEDAEILLIATSIEAEIAELEDLEEQELFLSEMGLEKPGVHHLIQATYRLLNLQTYFTAGVKEVRAWTIIKGMKAPQAAGVIHSDFEKGFIRAEVIAYNNFVALGSEQACKDAGKLSVEGKQYVVKDGDVMHFRFNV
ncbi:MAG: redox-regulated ATPase YchF [Flavobacteriales bacterium]|nr:redox-regulated ATPase YchF [Flavobacteriales bacterium]